MGNILNTNTRLLDMYFIIILILTVFILILFMTATKGMLYDSLPALLFIFILGLITLACGIFIAHAGSPPVGGLFFLFSYYILKSVYKRIKNKRRFCRK